VVYTTVWTVVVLPVAVPAEPAAVAGRFLAQHLWFLGTYAAVVLAVPWTVRWMSRPWVALPVLLAAVVLVDVLRWHVHPTLGWANLLVWAFIHQVGYHFRTLQRVSRRLLLAGAAVAGGAAVGLAVLGPYSSSMVTLVDDPEPSNLAPPTVVVALLGVAQVLLLAAAWPWLAQRLAGDRAHRVVRTCGARAIGVYLWHIPVVTVVVGLASALRLDTPPLGPAWWVVHLLAVGTVLPLAWVLAGRAARVEAGVLARTSSLPPQRPGGPLVVGALVPVLLLNVSVTGFATWWGPGVLGLPSSSPVNLGLLLLAWLWLARPASAPGSARPRPRTSQGMLGR
jgi:peptidoglycan/LPS O-acetylase OafA/YrhL